TIIINGGVIIVDDVCVFSYAERSSSDRLKLYYISPMRISYVPIKDGTFDPNYVLITW
ncbi:unnamed protein product, partial [marine sediment metagenome]